MRIAVSASNPDLSSPIDPRFGRCPYFLFVDPETMEFEAVQNPHVASTSGAGIQSAQFIAEKGAKAVLTGSCGPNAFQTLQAAGVEVIVGATGSVKEAVEQYKSGRFQATAQPNVPSHFGMGGSGGMGPGFGMGRGMGRSMGRGMGRGMGGGRGYGTGYGPVPQDSGAEKPSQSRPQMSAEEEIQELKKHSESLREQMEEISKRIKELEKNKK